MDEFCLSGRPVTKELAHVHAEGMSSTALRHGPLEMLDSTCGDDDPGPGAPARAGGGRI